MTSALLNDIGLVFDIAGALLLFKFGLPASVNREGHTFRITEAVDYDEIEKGKLYDRWGKIGLALLVAGFLLQLASNHL